MTRAALVVLAVLSVSAAQAQTYIGVSHTAVVGFSEFGIGYGSLLGVQVGAPVVGGVELRGTLETIIITSILGLDVLYPFGVAADVRGYVGGGADYIYFTGGSFGPSAPSVSSGGAFGFRGTAGLEYRANRVLGLYGELQPYFPSSGSPVYSPGLTVKLRTGLNVYF